MNSANQDKLMIEALVNLKGTLSILELSLHAATQEFQTVVDAQAVHRVVKRQKDKPQKYTLLSMKPTKSSAHSKQRFKTTCGQR